MAAKPDERGEGDSENQTLPSRKTALAVSTFRQTFNLRACILVLAIRETPKASRPRLPKSTQWILEDLATPRESPRESTTSAKIHAVDF